MSTATENEAPQQTARPSVITVSLKDKASMYAAYMHFVKGGGLFVATSRAANLGDDLFLLLSLPDDATKYALPGKVVWITLQAMPGRPQGLGVQFTDNDQARQVRAKIEAMIGAAFKSSRPAHTV